MTEGEQARRSTARLRLRPGDRLKSASTSQPLTEAEKRRFELEENKDRRNTKINLVIALVGVGGTLLGALSGAYFSRDQSAEEFRRDKQIAAYSEFLASASDLEQAQSTLWATASRRGPDKDKDADYDKWSKASSDLALKLAAVRLVAPPETAVDAIKILNLSIQKGITILHALDSPDEPSEDNEKKYEDITKEYLSVTEDFVDDARADLT